jgi:transcription termination/antitermination protein NusG
MTDNTTETSEDAARAEADDAESTDNGATEPGPDLSAYQAPEEAQPEPQPDPPQSSEPESLVAEASAPVDVEEAVPEEAQEAPGIAVTSPEEATIDAPVDQALAEGEEGEEEEEEDESDYFFAPGDWYVVHTYAGYENKVRANLSSRIQSMNMEDKIYDVVVPTEEVMELKSGKMQSVQKKVFPGYILVRMELDDDSWYVVRNTPGVTGFVGSGAKPTPLDSSEVTKILAPKTEERPRPKLDYEVGEVVSVVAGPFNGYSGPVNAIDVDKQQVTVLLDLFGRETPVELTFDQVTKL